MSCGGQGFSLVWTPPWGGSGSVPSAGGQQYLQTLGTVAAGDVAVFADATGRKVRKATAEELRDLRMAKYVPIEGSTQLQPVRFVEVEGVLHFAKDGDPVDPPWEAGE
jgi:hypothetical protein